MRSPALRCWLNHLTEYVEVIHGSALSTFFDAPHRQCIMITGDNPLTAAHVAREVDIVDRDVLILDVREGASNRAGIHGSAV
jgi:magnesium-transporting ATPase (P-type)